MNFEVSTKGHGDIIDLTAEVSAAVQRSGVTEGLTTVFVAGSTAAVTAMENEEGLKRDLKRILEKIAPEGADYEHHRRWGDRNGNAHILSALIGPSLTVPVAGGRPRLGAWQQVVLIDFDEGPRTREIDVTVVGTK